MIDFPFTGDTCGDANALFAAYGKDKTRNHSHNVAYVIIPISHQYKLDTEACVIAAYLHDISAVVSYADMLAFAEENSWIIYECEHAFPMLLHQRVSREIAQKYFNITDERILDAVGCHTTLRARATPYDMALFVADKLAWDGSENIGNAPFFEVTSAALYESLEAACLAYMNYMEEHNMLLCRPHPWWEEAKHWLKEMTIC